MVTLMPDENTVTVCVNGKCVGHIRLSDNPCHKRNCYIDLELNCYDNAISGELFEKLAQWTQRPLQAMLNSGDAKITDFLIAGGFACKRKCYEVEAFREDYVGIPAQTPLYRASAGERAYELCCETMYGHYINNHKDVNPWTAELSDFCSHLPKEVIYGMDEEEIVNIAFVEDGEIAYICSNNLPFFEGFAPSLINDLFARHETIFFESDDCDWAAMQLKSMFKNQDEVSFDTYVYDNKRSVY